jgi:hypothetical protein
MTLMIAVLLLVSASASAEAPLGWPAAAHPGPIEVKLEDGRTIHARGPVLGDDRTLLLRLPDDSMISVPADSVERIAVASASATAPAAKTRVTTPGRVYGNADLPPPLETGSAPPVTATADLVSPAAPAPLTFEGHRDFNGHDEQWWRDRVKRLHEELEGTEQEIVALESEYRVAKARTGAPMPRTVGGRSVLPRSLANRRTSSLEAGKVITLEEVATALDDAKARRDELKAEIAGLSDEARQANALPGWLR